MGASVDLLVIQESHTNASAASMIILDFPGDLHVFQVSSPRCTDPILSLTLFSCFLARNITDLVLEDLQLVDMVVHRGATRRQLVTQTLNLAC